jgi:hypothetical protein
MNSIDATLVHLALHGTSSHVATYCGLSLPHTITKRVTALLAHETPCPRCYEQLARSQHRYMLIHDASQARPPR